MIIRAAVERGVTFFDWSDDLGVVELLIFLSARLLRFFAINQARTATPESGDMLETIAKFFEAEDPVPSWRWESLETRAEREWRSSWGAGVGSVLSVDNVSLQRLHPERFP